MSRLTDISSSMIETIKGVLDFVEPLAYGDPIPDSSVYQEELNNFPQIDAEAQEAYELAVADESLREHAQTLVEASDRMSAVYTMLCDLLPARDGRSYDYYTVSMVLPYLSYSLSALRDIIDELEDRIAPDETKSPFVRLSDNVMFRRISAFVDESLQPYIENNNRIAGFRVFALQQLRKFGSGEDAEPFSFAFTDPIYTLSCCFDGDNLEMTYMACDIEESSIIWNLMISRNGDTSGNMDSGDLENTAEMKLTVYTPDEYEYYPDEDQE